jgi:folate-dependent phosphoribosylglycinamide formyltransferase PurN
MNLAGLIVISDTPARKWAVAKRAIRRSGLLNFLDVMAYRLFARVWLNPADEAWKAAEVARLKARYPARLDGVSRIVVKDPNSPAARDFIAAVSPDILLARCKFILKPDVFELARVGAFALHPGICPEYRNAHGCFWALAARDLERVGMTLLKIDKGVDTGPVYFQGGCPIDEVTESHTVIQYRVVTENLDRIGEILIALSRGADLEPISTTGRKSAVWGQPGLSTYLRWKHDAHSAAVSRRVCA